METIEDQARLRHRAARGERAAFAELAQAYVASKFDVTHFEAIAIAESLAALAAAHGDPGDNMFLAGVLRVRARHIADLEDYPRAAMLLAQSEALCECFPSLTLSVGVEYLAGVLSVLANEGDELAALRLAKVVAALPPADADKLRKTVDAGLVEAASDA